MDATLKTKTDKSNTFHFYYVNIRTLSSGTDFQITEIEADLPRF